MYVEFRKLLLDHNLSAQSVYQELMGLIVEGDEYMEQLLDRMETEKREKIVNKVRKTDAESIYKAIANKDASTKN
jgi:nitrogen-specific signal transduction histidine kinase